MENYKYILFSLLICLQQFAFSQNKDSEQNHTLSGNARISLITGEPGTELYTRFGHSAIRVKDPASGYDKVFNYGTFDFDAPGFYRKFLQGKLNYYLSMYDFERMMLNYKYLNQTLYEQELNLSDQEKKQVYQFLTTNYLPENRFYLYDFFFDNCSSRIRDVFKSILGERLIFDDDFIRDHKTFRQLLDEYLKEQTPWGDFGIDLVLGLPADQAASTKNYMFLPIELYRAFNHATLLVQGNPEPFVLKNHILINSITIKKESLKITPMHVFSGLLILMIVFTGFEVRYPVNLRVVDSILFFIVGLAGTILALLWFATDHIATKDNLNLLWAFPTHLIVPYLIFRKKLQKISAYYFLFWSIFLTLFLIGWNYLPQQFNLAIIPLVLLLILRSYRRYQISKRTSKNYVERRKQQIEEKF
jgi:hypothetical protein